MQHAECRTVLQVESGEKERVLSARWLPGISCSAGRKVRESRVAFFGVFRFSLAL
jgi:hypothetical protein